MDTSCDRLVVATGNPHKFEEFRRLLAVLHLPLQALSEFPLVRAVVEDGVTLADNAVTKASRYAHQLGLWVLADDTGLEVDALHGAPGVRSARYAGERATMAENRARLLSELRGVPPGQRAARFVCHVALADPTGAIVAQASGQCHGSIREGASGGAYGFGYDVLFEVRGRGVTLAELPPDESARWGHRGRAVEALLRQWRPR